MSKKKVQEETEKEFRLGIYNKGGAGLLLVIQDTKGLAWKSAASSR